MKVLHVINSLSTGGAEKLLLETIPLYKKIGLEVDLLLLNGASSPFLEQLKSIDNCRIYSLGLGSVYNPKHIFTIIPYLKKYDLIHVHLFPALYWVAIGKMISFSKTKLIFTEHNTSNSRFENYFFRQIDKIIYFNYNKVIAISPAVKEAVITKLKIKKKKCIVIYNGINLSKIIEAIPLDRNEYTNSKDEKLLIQISRFNKQKDHKTLIKAMAFLHESAKLLLVGDGYLRRDCEALVRNLGLENRVQFLGIRMDVAELLKASDLVIQCSHWEGFGLSAVEGMAARKPVIASNVSGLQEVVDGAGILFEKGNAEKLATSITLLLENKAYYDEISEKCYQRAKLYDIDLMVTETVKLYKSL
jgi:glycosyltransferase involved in cell wall biosynthesis